MDASTYFELHQAMDRILKLVRHEMYKGVRSGTIPPDAIAGVADEIRIQVAWMDVAQKRG